MRPLMLLPLVAALVGGCSLYSHWEALDMTGCMPSPACEVDGGNDMHIPDGGEDGMCMIMCPLLDMADLSVLPDLAHECLDSSTCPEARPLCNASGTCVTCGASNDAGTSTECATFHAPKTLCGPAGACVQCLSKDDCQAFNQTCDTTTHACAPCQQHTDCTTGACKPGGACASSSEVSYVNRGSGSCSDLPHTSTPAAPYCQITAAVSPSPKPYTVVTGNATAYDAVSFNSTTGAIGPLTIIGPGRSAAPPATIAGSGAVTPNGFAVLTGAGNTATVTLDGLVLTGAGGATPGAGARCTVGTGAASLTIRNSLIQNSGQAGVDSSGCTLVIDANVIGPTNAGGGIVLGGTTSYTVTNNIVWGNGSVAATTPGVQIANGATGTLAFNTIVKNTVSGAAGVGGIDCGSGGTKAIQHSIAYQNTTSSGTQIGAQCTLTNVVTVMGDDTKGTMSAMAPVFVSATDYHLVAGAAANLACCIDKLAAPGTPNANHDVDNTTRPKGASATPYDISANEVQ